MYERDTKDARHILAVLFGPHTPPYTLLFSFQVDNVTMQDDIIRAIQRVQSDVIIEVPNEQLAVPGRNAIRQSPRAIDSGHCTPDSLVYGRRNNG